MCAAPLAVVLVDFNFECNEFHYPRLRLKEAGYRVLCAGQQLIEYKSKEGVVGKADVLFADVDPTQVRVLVVPGGWAPDRLRRWPECLALCRAVHAHGGVVGAICHGGSVLISANLLRGVKCTAFCAIRDDLVNAGCVWSDDKCVVDKDKRMVSAQTPEDLPQFMRAILDLDNELRAEPK